MTEKDEIKALQAAAVQAAQSFEWEEVRDLYSTALDKPDIPPEIEYELRIGRADAYTYLANPYSARVDMEVAVHLAKGIENPVLEAEALIGQSRALVITDGPSAGLSVAEEALILVREIGAHRLESDCLDSLTSAYYLLDNLDYSERYLEQWERLFDDLDYPIGLARSLVSRARHTKRFQGDNEEAQTLVEKALKIYRRLGDRNGEISALNTIAMVSSDIGLSWMQKLVALDIANQSGFRHWQLNLYNNLAFSYYRFGLYKEAHYLARRAVELGPRTANHRVQVVALATLAECYLGLRDHDSARKETTASKELAQKLGMPMFAEPYPALLYGLADYHSGEFEEARKHMMAAVSGFGELSNPGFQATALAWLGAAEIAVGDLDAALENTAEAVSNPDVVPQYPAQELWWWRYQALKKQAQSENGSITDEAWKALNRARGKMLDGVSDLSDEGLRRNYLNKVAVNRNIAEEWSKIGEEQGHIEEAFLERETSHASLHQQFQRLVSIGNRLTSQRDPQILPQTILNHFVELSGAERAFLVLGDSIESRDFEWVCDEGIDEDEALGVKSFAEDLMAEILTTRQPEIFDSNGSVPDGGLEQLHLRSAVILPLISQGRIKGVLYGDLRHIFGRFEKRDIDLLSLLANQAAAALENAEWSYSLEQQVEQRTTELSAANAELEVINSVQRGLASRLEFKTIIDLVGDTLQDIFGTDDLGIALYDSQTGILTTPYFLEHSDRFDIEPSPLGTGFTAHVIETKQPLLVTSEIEKRMEELGSHAIGDPEAPLPKQYLGVPILSGEDVIGVISTATKDRDKIFDDSMVSLVSTLSSSMSVALENARLFDETKVLLDETEQRNAELTIINSAVSALAKQLDYQSIIDLVGEKIREVFEADTAYIILYDKNTNMLSAPYFVERGYRHTPPPWELDASSSLVSRIVESRQPLNIGTFEESIKLGAYKMPSPGEEEDLNESYLGVPILVGDDITGAVGVQSYKQYAFDQSDVRLINTIATNTGVALENARLFDETSRLLAETEQRNSELAVINSVQKGLAAELDVQAIYDLVGDQIRDIFDAQAVMISTYDLEQNLNIPRYMIEKNQRYYPDTGPITPFHTYLIENKQPVVVNENASEFAEKHGMSTVGDSEPAKSMVFVPMVVGDVARGFISLQNIDHEHAFSDSDVRLLTTLSSSMSVALENARLFAETTRLLAETEQRNSELAVINTVQKGLAAELDMQAINDLVGDQIRDIFDAQVVLITSFDHDAELNSFDYTIEKGERIYRDPSPFTDFHRHLIRTKETVLINENSEEKGAQYGLQLITGTEQPKSLLFVPLIVGGTVKGLFSLQNIDHENAFSNSDVRLLTTLSSSMSVALENARLFAETTRLLAETGRRVNELTTVNRISQALASELELEALIELVGEQTRKTFAADIAYVALHNQQSDLIDFPYQYGDEIAPIKFGEGLTSRIIDSGEPLLINQDIEAHVSELEAIRIGAKALSYLGVPIRAGGQAIGAISVQSTSTEGRFGDDDVRLLNTIAANVGAAIQNARLYQESQRSAEEMATLAEIGSDIAATRELEPVLERMTARVMELLNVGDIALFLPEPDGKTFRANIVLGKIVEEIKANPITLGNGIIGSVLHNKEAEYINAPYKDPRARHIPGTSPPEEEREALMAAPLLSRGEVIGGIAMWRPHDDGLFTNAELDFLVSVARQAAIAIESARLYMETQRRAEEMSALAAVGRDISATLESEAVLERIATHARELLAADTSAVYLPDPGDQTLHAIVALGEIADEIKADTIRAGEGIIGDLYKRGASEVINDTVADPRARQIPGTADIPEERLMIAPLLSGERVNGMMAVWRSGPGEQFTNEHLRFLRGLAQQAAIAIENARLFAETRRQKQYFEALVQSSPAAILTIDMDGKGETWNPAAERLFGYSEAEAVGQSVDSLVASADSIHSEALEFNELVSAGESFRGITQRTRKDGELVDVELFAQPVVVDDDQVGMIAIYHDITEILQARRQAEEARQEAELAQEDAERANTAKSTFLANMSHELRTPLNAIIGFTRIVKRKAKDALPQKQIDNLEKVLVSAEHLLGLINTILDISKIEAGRMDVQPSTFDTHNLIEDCVTTAQPLMKTGVRLEIDVKDDLPPIHSDQDKLKQILLNLLSNAAKFTHEGAITVTACRRDDLLEIDVSDTGIGISPEDLGRVFEEFQQADSGSTRQYGGTGLGLPISRQLARLLGGELIVTSKAGEGSTFTLSVPLRYGEELKQVERTGRPISITTEVDGGEFVPDADHPLVLAIDDDPDVVYLLQEDLGDAGYQVIGAMSGEEGMRKALEFKPVAITLDIMMPQKDGWQVLHELKTHPDTRDIPVIMLSIVDKKALGFQLGAADYLVKPLDSQEVLEALRRLTVVNGGKKPRRLLVVDDDPNVIDLARQLLEGESIEIDAAGDGSEAMTMIAQRKPDAILLDLMMPKMDGFAVIEQLNQATDLQDIPVIVLTAKTLTAAELELLQDSAAQIILKQGLEAEVLLAGVRSALT